MILKLWKLFRCGSTGAKGSYSSSLSTGSLSTTALSNTASMVTAGVSSTVTGHHPTYSSAYERFKYGELFGGWLSGTEAILESSEESLLGKKFTKCPT